MAISKEIITAAMRVFSKPAADTVLHYLALYDGSDAEDVHLSILVLIGSDEEDYIEEAAESLVATANEGAIGRSDVCFWAKYPEEAGLGTLEEFMERYRAFGLPIP